jgi:alpha-tubulin suppressor-like RCC1 family protein
MIVSGMSGWAQVTAARYGASAIKTDGTLWCWGRNNYGQLGDGTTIDRSSPVQITTGGAWVSVVCGPATIMAIKSDGTLWGWGANGYGQLGDNTTISRSSPVQIVSGGTNWINIAGGGNGHFAGTKTDGTFWCWGWNNNYQLGDNTTTSRSSPVQVMTGGTNWTKASCGNYITGGIKTDGTLWLWGNNYWGDVGTNTAYNVYSSPIQTIMGGTTWKSVSVGYNFVMAIRDSNY